MKRDFKLEKKHLTAIAVLLFIVFLNVTGIGIAAIHLLNQQEDYTNGEFDRHVERNGNPAQTLVAEQRPEQSVCNLLQGCEGEVQEEAYTNGYILQYGGNVLGQNGYELPCDQGEIYLYGDFDLDEALTPWDIYPTLSGGLIPILVQNLGFIVLHPEILTANYGQTNDIYLANGQTIGLHDQSYILPGHQTLRGEPDCIDGYDIYGMPCACPYELLLEEEIPPYLNGIPLTPIPPTDEPPTITETNEEPPQPPVPLIFSPQNEDPPEQLSTLHSPLSTPPQTPNPQTGDDSSLLTLGVSALGFILSTLILAVMWLNRKAGAF